MIAQRGRSTTHHVASTRFLAVLALLLAIASSALAVAPAVAMEAIALNGTEERVEITRRGLAIEGRGDKLQVNTAAGEDGLSRRMSVDAAASGTNPNWIVFALRNTTDKVMERWITVERYSLIGSGVIWPDLDSRRLEALTPSVGFLPQRIANDRADIFKITIDPGQTVTYAAEMANKRLSRIFLWKPLAYEFEVLDQRLFNGIMLGIVGLLGVFLTAIFAANHRAIFPSAALLTWCVLAYLCVDFGFWHKLLQLSSTDNAAYRAATEAAMATSLSIFLHTFLRLGSWHGLVRIISSVWIFAHLSLVFIAIVDPRLASTAARLSFGALGLIGTLLILFLALRGQERAVSLMPTWILFLVWLFGLVMTVTGQLSGDLVVALLISGLVLLALLVGFTVTQYAFRSVDPHYGTAPSEQQLRSIAVDGAGAAVWEWHARRDEVKVGPIVEAALGLNQGELSTKLEKFVNYLHPADQQRMHTLLWSIKERDSGLIRTNFRLRHADNSYRWFDLEAASVPTSDRRSLRCVGLLRDVTDQKRAQSDLMHDAVHDKLTNLPNRELFLDRLKVAVGRTRSEPSLRPVVLLIGLDKFKQANAQHGLVVGDSLIKTVAYRLSRQLAPQDTLARIGGDQFAILVLSNVAQDFGQFAERIRRSIRAPINMAGQDIVITGAIGVAFHDPSIESEMELVQDAEVAMYRAKRSGADQVEIFRPDMRNERDDHDIIEADLRHALDRQQIQVLYQPIIYLPTEELAGFEAIVRWVHPKHGVLNPYQYVPESETSDLVERLGTYVLMDAVEQAASWQKQLPRSSHPLFVSVNISNRELFRQDLVQDVRQIMSRSILPDRVLRLEVKESLVMENPEQATGLLESLKLAGAGLTLDEFGAGFSSLSYLERMPFDSFKIDRELLHYSSSESNSSVLVRSIMAFAQQLERNVIAEGVEVSEDTALLRSIGCQFAQGYYYGEPMTQRDVADLLKIVRRSERKLSRRGILSSILAIGDRDDTLADDTTLPPSKALPKPMEAAEPPPVSVEPEPVPTRTPVPTPAQLRPVEPAPPGPAPVTTPSYANMHQPAPVAPASARASSPTPGAAKTPPPPTSHTPAQPVGQSSVRTQAPPANRTASGQPPSNPTGDRIPASPDVLRPPRPQPSNPPASTRPVTRPIQTPNAAPTAPPQGSYGANTNNSNSLSKAAAPPQRQPSTPSKSPPAPAVPPPPPTAPAKTPPPPSAQLTPGIELKRSSSRQDSNAEENAKKQPPKKEPPALSPGVAQSLARLAGLPDEDDQPTD